MAIAAAMQKILEQQQKEAPDGITFCFVQDSIQITYDKTNPLHETWMKGMARKFMGIENETCFKCPNDTDGDGNCHLCKTLSKGCPMARMTN